MLISKLNLIVTLCVLGLWLNPNQLLAQQELPVAESELLEIPQGEVITPAPGAAPTLVAKKADEVIEKRISKQVLQLVEELSADPNIVGLPSAADSISYQQLTYSDEDYIVAHVAFNGLRRFQFAYVFDLKQDKLVYRSDKNHKGVSDLVITTLGSDTCWFLWLQSWNEGLENGSPLHRHSVVIPIDGNFQVALSVDHYANDVAYSSTPA